MMGIPYAACAYLMGVALTIPPAPQSDAPKVSPNAPSIGSDYTWVSGNGRIKTSERPISLGPVVGELRVDSAYHYLMANPADDTISGTSEAFRHGELQLTHVAVGGDFAQGPVHGRVMTQFGLYSETTPRNDSSPGRGQWNLADAYRHLSEAYLGYRFDVLRGINVQAGLFMSFIGLWSYYNADNWTYQPSYVSSSTPWFFNGVRVQIQLTDALKIEPWIINGWQSYGRFNQAPGIGAQVVWRPAHWLSITGNHYVGFDTPGLSGRLRAHGDESLNLKYYERAGRGITKAAVSLTVDVGCEEGDGAHCSSQYFAGAMAYHRAWFAHDRAALTLGGGVVANPGRYLTLLPPVNGATAVSGTPYFTANPKDPFKAFDAQASLDIMPSPLFTFRVEYVVRGANVPYFAGRRGMTPPGGNQGPPGSQVPGWAPDLRSLENRVTLALLLRT